MTLTKVRRMQMKLLIKMINKEYGKNAIGFAPDLGFDDIERVTSGSLFLDWALGKSKNTSGWPLGRIIELYGPESSGKSLISMLTIAGLQKMGKDCVYFDCENSFDKEHAKTLGVNPDKLIISRESGAEKVIDMACRILEKGKPSLIVFDSLAAMIPTVEVENSLEKQQMASVARVMSKGLRKLTLFNKNNTLIIFINQLRVNPGAMYGNPEYTPSRFIEY